MIHHPKNTHTHTPQLRRAYITACLQNIIAYNDAYSKAMGGIFSIEYYYS